MGNVYQCSLGVTAVLARSSCSIFFLNSFTTKKQMTKFSSANFQKMLSPSYIILRIQRLRANSVDLDEMAHYVSPHQNLRCLQIWLFLCLVLKEFINC